eukprot:m.308253 g.308253  ORF g.308253 m.308253 type:complete len:106 (+) comp43637_c0_seq1:162-479(+)
MAWRQQISQRLKEIRIHLCQTSPNSQGIRDFVEAHYVDLKKANPKFPFLIRECSGVQPRIYARYDYGRERMENVSNLNKEEVGRTLESLVLASDKETQARAESQN